jgi:hypothetical protein
MTGLMDPEDIFREHPDLLALDAHQQWLAEQVDQPHGVLTETEMLRMFEAGIRPGHVVMLTRNETGTLNLHEISYLPQYGDDPAEADR